MKSLKTVLTLWLVVFFLIVLLVMAVGIGHHEYTHIQRSRYHSLSQTSSLVALFVREKEASLSGFFSRVAGGLPVEKAKAVMVVKESMLSKMSANITVFLLDASGTISEGFCPSLLPFKGMSLMNLKEVATSVREHKITMGGVYVSPFTGLRVVPVVFPSPHGWILRVEIPTEIFMNLIRASVKTAKARLFVFNKYGDILLHSDQKFPGDMAGLGLITDKWKEIKHTSGGTMTFRLRGEKMVGSFVPLAPFKLFLATVIPESRIIASVMNSVMALFLTGLCALLILFLLSYRVLFAFVVSPLNEISSGISVEGLDGSLASLDPATGKGFREFSTLIGAFNAMAGRIRSQMDKITRLESMMRNILDSSPAIVVALDAGKRIWYLNEAGERFFKVSKRDAEGKSLQGLNPELSGYETRIDAVLTAREPEFLRSEKWLNDKMVDGAIYPLVANGNEGVVIQWLDVSEKYRARESYRSRLEAIFSHMEDLIYVVAPDYSIEFINKKMARLVKLREMEQPCYKIIRNCNAPCPDCNFPEVKSGRTVKKLFQSPFGNGRTYDLIAAPLENEDGSLSILSVLRDITEDMAIQDALRASETAYRNLFEQAPVGMSLHQTGKFVMVNQAFCNIVGYSSEELVGASIFKIVHPDEVDFITQRIKKISIEKTNVEPAREKYLRRDGVIIEVLVFAFPSIFQGKHAVQTVVIDLTEQVQLQASLLRSEAFSAEVLEKALDPIVVVDAETMAIVDANPPAENFFSLSMDRLIGARWEDFFKEEDLPGIEKSKTKLTSNGAVRVTNREMILPSGRRVVDLSVIMVETADEQARYIAFIKDLTEFNAVQERLAHAQKQESLWQMAGGFAHDFNNILAIMFGYLDMIEMVNDGDPRQKAYIDKLKEVSERARDLVQNILMFSGLDEGERKPHGIREIIDATVDLARPVIDQLVDFKVIIINPEDVIFVDKTRMVQVLLNLLLNARDAIGLGKPGKIGLECRRKQLTEEEGRLIDLTPGFYEEIRISDTGTGIPRDIRDRVFDPFFTTKGKGTQKGTGLGLAIVQSIVSNYGGGLHFKTSGAGTHFFLLIPLGKTVETADVVAEDVVTTVKGKGRILIVEDEVLLRDVSKEMLETLGYQVDEACDGREAVEKITAFPDQWDVVLMDLSMPRLGGEEALKIIRDLHQDLKIVIMSGLADEETRKRVLEAKATAFIRKPINMSNLSDVISRVLSE